MNIAHLRNKDPLIDALLDIADQYFRKGTAPFSNLHDDWCRSSDGGSCDCHRGKFYRELEQAAKLVSVAPFQYFKAKANFDIKAGEFFVVNLNTAEVLLESLPPDAKMSPSKAAPKGDAVNHPSHYNTGKIEVVEFIEDQRLDYHAGNAVKYVCRAGRKDPTKEIEDLKKAVWYLARKIEILSALKEGRELRRPNDMNRGANA